MAPRHAPPSTRRRHSSGPGDGGWSRRLIAPIVLALCVVGVAIGLIVTLGGSGGDTKKTSATSPVPAATTPSARHSAAQPAAPQPVDTQQATGARGLSCPAATRTVHDGASLTSAFKAAEPGDVIELADGTYSGGFTLGRSGTQAKPLWVCGSRHAVIDGGDKSTPYTLHLDQASWVRLVGFSVTGGRKGVMADHVQHSVISGLSVSDTGDEAIHLRAFSSDNEVVANVIRSTGHRRGKFGEGVYVGTAKSNWPDYSGGNPDKSDRNQVIGNDIAGTTSENIDVKEGTTGGVVADNRLSSIGMTAADSWIDVKGNGWTVYGNVGTGGGSIKDGIQTHMVVDGWGLHNVIRSNRLTVDADGYGVYIHNARDNTVACDNVVSGAASGFSNMKCVR